MLALSTSALALHSARAPAPRMTEASSKVKSWYDNGQRINVKMTATATPPKAAPVEAAAPPAPVGPVGIVGTRPAYTWNPQGLTAPETPVTPFNDQFVPQFLTGVPSYLDGSTYQGDNGFDPWALAALAEPSKQQSAFPELCLSGKKRLARLEAMSPEERAESVAWMREAELKHARLAMLAAAGWPMAELLNGGGLAATNGRAPSLFNGQLIENLPFVAVVFGALAFLEVKTGGTSANSGSNVIDYGSNQNQPGDYGFDPLSQYTEAFPKREMQLAEIKHGRAAMMGITGFAVQEFFWGTPVVQQTGFFFGK